MADKKPLTLEQFMAFLRNTYEDCYSTHHGDGTLKIQATLDDHEGNEIQRFDIVGLHVWRMPGCACLWDVDIELQEHK